MQLDQYLADAIALLSTELTRLNVQVRRDLDQLAADIVSGCMTKDSITRAEIDDLIERLSAAMPEAEQRLAADAVLAALARYRRFTAAAHGEQPPHRAAQSQPAKIPVAAMRSGPFLGMSLRDAAFEQLKRHGKQTSREIWTALEAGGFISAHQDPGGAVHMALHKRSRSQKDVFLVGEGMWDLCGRYSDDERAGIKARLHGQAGRDARLHRAQTTQGMQVAKARGVRLGAKKKLTADEIVAIESMVRTGSTIQAAAKAFNVAPGTIYNNIERDRIADLREEAEKLKSDGVSSEEVRH